MPVVDFHLHPGTNNTKDYTPGSLTQTTWFRRTVTSGSFSNTSNVIEVNVAALKGLDTTYDVHLFKGNTEIRDIIDESMINIYPVPNKGHFTVAITSEVEKNIDIMVFSVHGTKVFEKNNVIVKDRTEITFDLVFLPAGIYYLKFMDGKIQVIKKIVICE